MTCAYQCHRGGGGDLRGFVCVCVCVRECVNVLFWLNLYLQFAPIVFNRHVNVSGLFLGRMAFVGSALWLSRMIGLDLFFWLLWPPLPPPTLHIESEREREGVPFRVLRCPQSQKKKNTHTEDVQVKKMELIGVPEEARRADGRVFLLSFHPFFLSFFFFLSLHAFFWNQFFWSDLSERFISPLLLIIPY